MKLKMLENYKGFINVLFGILIAVIGYLVVNKLGQIDNSLQQLAKFQQEQLVKSENFELRIQSVEKTTEENKKKIDEHVQGKK